MAPSLPTSVVATATDAAVVGADAAAAVAQGTAEAGVDGVGKRWAEASSQAYGSALDLQDVGVTSKITDDAIVKYQEGQAAMKAASNGLSMVMR